MPLYLFCKNVYNNTPFVIIFCESYWSTLISVSVYSKVLTPFTPVEGMLLTLVRCQKYKQCDFNSRNSMSVYSTQYNKLRTGFRIYSRIALFRKKWGNLKTRMCTRTKKRNTYNKRMKILQILIDLNFEIANCRINKYPSGKG